MAISTTDLGIEAGTASRSPHFIYVLALALALHIGVLAWWDWPGRGAPAQGRHSLAVALNRAGTTSALEARGTSATQQAPAKSPNAAPGKQTTRPKDPGQPTNETHRQSAATGPKPVQPSHKAPSAANDPSPATAPSPASEPLQHDPNPTASSGQARAGDDELSNGSVASATNNPDSSLDDGDPPFRYAVRQQSFESGAAGAEPRTELSNGEPTEEGAARVASLVRDTMDRHFSYPPLARRRGWQGLVKLGLRVEADGVLSQIRVVETSGHRLLDRDAVETLRRVAAIPNAGGWLRGRHFDMVLPVQYRLVDG